MGVNGSGGVLLLGASTSSAGHANHGGAENGESVDANHFDGLTKTSRD